MIIEKLSIKNKTLLLVSSVMLLIVLSAEALFIFNQNEYLQSLQDQDELFIRYMYEETFKRQQLQDIATLDSFINTPGFAHAFVQRDRNAVIRLWNDRWDSLKKNDTINILQLHEANGRSFVRMHEQDYYGDMIVRKRPMIAHAHKTRMSVSGFELGVYGLAYRVTLPIVINGHYEGCLEIGSDPKRLINSIHTSTNMAGFVLIPRDPLLRVDIYKKQLGKYWMDSEAGITSKLLIKLEKGQIVGNNLSIHDNFNQYTSTVIALKNYQEGEVSKIIFIRDNTAKMYAIYLKVFFYVTAAFALVLLILYFINRWLGSLIGQLEKNNHNLLIAMQEVDRYKGVLDSHNIVSKGDLDGIITYVNDNFCHISGYSREELIGQPHSIIRHPDMSSDIFKGLWDSLLRKESWIGIVKNRKKDGSSYYVDTLIVPFFNEQGNTTEYISARHDITEQVEGREDMERAARTDVLTQLGNRFALINDLTSLSNPSLALLDIDYFSEINDFYGQRIGDEVILRLSHLVREITKGEAEFYRLGGDVFALLADQMDRQSFIALSHKIAAEIRLKPLVVFEKIIPIETTIGISFESCKRLVSTCDMALTIGKKQKVPFVIYTEELSLEKEYENNIYCTLKLKKALKENRIVTHYQPIVNNKTGKVDKYEVLVRLVDEGGEIISPFFFLDIAKKSKQYHEITKRIIKSSFERFAKETVSFSINLTIEDILCEDFNVYFYQMLAQYDVKGRVVIELVESEGIENFEQVVGFILKAKEYGCAIAIDDFGTGYSNFEYLLRLQPDFIKIDGSMIRYINSDVNMIEVIKTIVDFAKRTGIKTIAEYVCDEAVYNTVKELGVDYSQGYYFGKPRDTLMTNG